MEDAIEDASKQPQVAKIVDGEIKLLRNRQVALKLILGADRPSRVPREVIKQDRCLLECNHGGASLLEKYCPLKAP